MGGGNGLASGGDAAAHVPRTEGRPGMARTKYTPDNGESGQAKPAELYAIPQRPPTPATTALADMDSAGVGAPPAPTPPRQRTPWPDDIDVIFEKDPAARNILEVLTYQGLHALLLHRLAHKLYAWGVPALPRLISQAGRILTGGI